MTNASPTWEDVRRIRHEVIRKLIELEHAIAARGRIALRNLRSEIVDDIDPERPR